MCLGVPGKIVEIYEQGGLLMGKIDFGGVAREVCLAYVPEAKIGDYAVVHVGFALNLLDEAEAQETLALLKEIGLFDEQLEAQPADVNEELWAGGTVPGG